METYQETGMVIMKNAVTYNMLVLLRSFSKDDLIFNRLFTFNPYI